MPLSRQRRVSAGTSIELVTIPNVELLEVGMDWETSTGTFTFTEDDLLSAVNAMADPAVRTPVGKLGHVDPRFDGDFSIGRFDNLRVTNNNQTLLSDWVGVPRWFAEITAAAYPRRSIEGRWDWETYTGNRWPFYLTAVALLGASYPAIATLEDIRAFWAGEPVVWQDVAASEDPPYMVRTERGMVGRADRVDAGADDGMKWKRKVDASTEVSDIVRAFYDSLDANQSWWWIRTVQVDPPQLIVDDDDGHLYRVGYTVKNDEVEFADPVMVKVQYEDVSDKKAAASTASWSSDATAVTYPTRDASRGATVSPRASEPTPEDPMNAEQKALIGLPADATDDQVTAKLTELAASATPPAKADEDADAAAAAEAAAKAAKDAADAAGTPATPEVPEGMVLVDAATLDELKRVTTEVSAKFASDETARRTAIVDAALKAGKFPKSRREHYDALMASTDPKVVENTEKLIAAMPAGLIPVGAAEVGTGGGDEIEGNAVEAYPAHWLPEVAARGNGAAPTIVTEA